MSVNRTVRVRNIPNLDVAPSGGDSTVRVDLPMVMENRL
jgi:hypothetical protein